jgi:hypothetical protein
VAGCGFPLPAALRGPWGVGGWPAAALRAGCRPWLRRWTAGPRGWRRGCAAAAGGRLALAGCACACGWGGGRLLGSASALSRDGRTEGEERGMTDGDRKRGRRGAD